MRAGLAALLLWVFAQGAQAEGCPPFFRFVDFGLVSQDGRVHRGGTVFRAEDFNGTRLHLREGTVCRDLREVSKDGHGNPIPVVTRIAYDPRKTGLDLEALSVRVVDDAAAMAAASAKAHRARLAQDGVAVVRGDNFLCAQAERADGLSCQVASPYRTGAAPVVYCEALRCEMPVLAISDRLVISAAWLLSQQDIEIAGPSISGRVGAIRDFLSPLSSGL